MDGLRHHPLVFVDDLDQPELSEADRHHFERALRVEPGAPILLGDGRGRVRPARFGPVPEVTGPIEEPPSPGEPLTVGFVPVKGVKAEWVVQKLTELGIDRIVPLQSARSVVRWDHDQRRQHKHEARLAAVAREACLQCRRLSLPEVGSLTPLAAFLAAEPAAVLADPGGQPPQGDERTVVVGPEGGFSPDELALVPHLALPGHVLRAETAVVAAAVVVAGLRSGLLGSPPDQHRA